MLFVENIVPEETYGMYELFGHDKFFYKDTIIRVIGWETPVSVIYREGEDIKLRFKKEIERYAAGFQDAPYEPHCLDFGDFFKKRYEKEEPMRRMNYALKQYKKERQEFIPVKLYPNELKERLQKDDLLSDVHTFNKSHALFSAKGYWFPVDVDTVILDTSDRLRNRRDEAAVLSYTDDVRLGHVGYDKRFYHIRFRSTHCSFCVYRLDNGMSEVTAPYWMENAPFCGTEYRFLKEYILTPNQRCYDYNGRFLEEKTRHHIHIRQMNEWIRLLHKPSDTAYTDKPYTCLLPPQNFAEFHIADVERLIVPHLQSKNELSTTALEQFRAVRKIVERAGLAEDFGVAVGNILNMNRSRAYGGSKRKICGEALLANLNKLSKKLKRDELAALLQNRIELKKAIARIHGTKVAEITVSNEAYAVMRKERRIPRSLKKNDAFCRLAPDTLVVVSTDGEEPFCIVTTQTQAGLGMNRA